MIALSAVLASSGTAAASQSLTYQQNAAHTGATSEPGLDPPFARRWAVDLGQATSYPVIADGRVFVVVRNASTYGTQLFALDAGDGHTLWQKSLGGTYYWSGIAYGGGRVYAVNGDGLLVALSRDGRPDLVASARPVLLQLRAGVSGRDGVRRRCGQRRHPLRRRRRHGRRALERRRVLRRSLLARDRRRARACRLRVPQRLRVRRGGGQPALEQQRRLHGRRRPHDGGRRRARLRARRRRRQDPRRGERRRARGVHLDDGDRHLRRHRVRAARRHARGARGPGDDRPLELQRRRDRRLGAPVAPMGWPRDTARRGVRHRGHDAAARAGGAGARAPARLPRRGHDAAVAHRAAGLRPDRGRLRTRRQRPARRRRRPRGRPDRPPPLAAAIAADPGIAEVSRRAGRPHVRRGRPGRRADHGPSPRPPARPSTDCARRCSGGAGRQPGHGPRRRPGGGLRRPRPPRPGAAALVHRGRRRCCRSSC